jgi:hypothetical protein
MMMTKKSASMVIVGLAFGLAMPAAALAQDTGSGPTVQSPMQLPGTAGAPAAQVPQPQEEPGVNWKGVGVGAGTVVGNALYMPAKLVYGILGGIAGGAGWALTGGNTQVSNTIWRSSLGGDYVLTPNMVAGKEPIHFSGPTSTAVPAPAVDSSANGAGSNSPAMTASSSNPPAGQGASSYSPSSMAPSGSRSSSGGTHPIDHGAGPIGGSSSGLSGPLPRTSIE